MTAENINWREMNLIYWCVKLNNQREPCGLGIGPTLAGLLRELPATGLLFPKISLEGAKQRAAEFRRRRIVAGISGVKLHSFRYAWAERAYELGYPERFAQAALGHSSKAVHRAYARGAKVKCPPLEGYAPGSQKIILFIGSSSAAGQSTSPASA